MARRPLAALGRQLMAAACAHPMWLTAVYTAPLSTMAGTLNASASDPPTQASEAPSRFEPLAVVTAAQAGLRVDALLRGMYELAVVDADGDVPGPIPMASLQKWARLRLLRVRSDGGEPLPPKDALCAHRLRRGDCVLLHRDVAAKLRRLPEAAPRGDGAQPAWLAAAAADGGASLIRHADDTLVAISKPAGVPVQGGTGIDARDAIDACLPAIGRAADAVSRRQQQQQQRQRPAAPADDGRLRLVHRLDRDVSGLLLLARGRAAAARLTGAFRDGAIRKTYMAVVGARLPPGVPLQGALNAPVVDAEYDRSGALVTKASEAATTAYTAHVLTKSGHSGGSSDAAAAAITLLFLEPSTGRKHQLRQHVLHLFRGRAAIHGDKRYDARRLPREMRAALGLPPAPEATAAALPAGPLPPPPRGAGIALHSLKATLPPGTLGPQQDAPLHLKDSAGVPLWLRRLLREFGWEVK